MNRRISQFWLEGARLTLHDQWAEKDARSSWSELTPEELADWMKLGDREQRRRLNYALEHDR